MKIPLQSFESWLMAKSLTKKTIDQYIYYFSKFTPYGKFNQESVSKFLSVKGNRNIVSRSFLLNFKKFLMINYKEFGIDKDTRIDISEVELPSISGRPLKAEIKPLTEDQILNIEKHLDDEREKLKLILSYYGGLRIGELLKIQVVSFNWEQWQKNMEDYGECTVFGKGNKERIVFYHPIVMKRVAKYIRSKNFPSLNSYIFLNNIQSLKNINLDNRARIWQTKLKKAAIKAGIVKIDPDNKIVKETDIHPHTLRHSWGYYLQNVLGLDLRTTQGLLGHSSITSTQRYTFIENARLKQDLIKKTQQFNAG